MQMTAIVYLLAIVGMALIGLGIYGIVQDKFRQETAGKFPWLQFTLPLSAFVLLMGLASLGISGFFAEGGLHASTTDSAPQDVQSQSPASVSASASATIAQPAYSGRVVFSQPSFGSGVRSCAVFRGTADLPPDQTLVLSMENMSDPTKTLYLAPVNDWMKTSEIGNWNGFQYFGSGDSSVGQKYEVAAVAMKLAAVKAAEAQPANNPEWKVASLPRGAVTKVALRVVRISGVGPAVCQ